MKRTLIILILWIASTDLVQGIPNDVKIGNRKGNLLIGEISKNEEQVIAYGTFPSATMKTAPITSIPDVARRSIVFLGRSYNGFKEALAFKESRGNYCVVNTLGYLGKYQFGITTLELMGVKDASKFLLDPVLQEKVFRINIARNKWILRRDIKRFKGSYIGDLLITESGILAAAHLAGAGNVKKYLRSYGEYDVQDAYGTNMAKYLNKFGGYDISVIAAKRNPKVQQL